MLYTGIKETQSPTLFQSLRVPLAITVLFQALLTIAIGPVFLRPELDERTQPFAFVEAQKLAPSDELSSFRSEGNSPNHLAIVFPRYGFTLATIFSSNLARQAEFGTREQGEAQSVIAGDFKGNDASEWILSIPLTPQQDDNDYIYRKDALRLVYWDPDYSIEREIDRIPLKSRPHTEVVRTQRWRGRATALGNPHSNVVDTTGNIFALGLALSDPPFFDRMINIYRKGSPPEKVASISCAVFPQFGTWCTLPDGQRVLTVGGTVLGNGVKVPVEISAASGGTARRDTLDDGQGTVMQVSSTGKVRWVRKLSRSGGEVYVYPRTGHPDELLAVFSRDAFNFGTDELDILILDAATGKVISSSTYPGSYQHLVGKAAEEMGIAGIIRTDTRFMHWLTLEGTASPVLRIRGLKRAVELPALKLAADVRVVAIPRANGEGTLLYTPEGRCVGASSSGMEANVARIRIEDEDVDVVPLYSENYSLKHLVYYVHNPYEFWWFWRYRWWIILLFGPPIITFAVVSTQRYIVERRTAIKAVEAYNVQLRHLTRWLHESQEQERTQLSREIHDSVGQSLAVIRWGLAEIRSKDRKRKTEAENLIAQVDDALAEIRRIAQELRPSLLDDLGLVPALEWYLKTVGNRTGLKITLQSDEAPEDLPPELATALFRIVQEGISNVLKHASASRIRIAFTLDRGEMQLRIEDNGKGVKDHGVTSRTPLGMMGMRERLMPFHGRIVLENGKRGGACLTAFVPVRDGWFSEQSTEKTI